MSEVILDTCKYTILPVRIKSFVALLFLKWKSPITAPSFTNYEQRIDKSLQKNGKKNRRNHGYNLVSFATGMSEIQKWYILEMLNLLGHTFETVEEKLEGYALISAMLPTYFR